MSSSTRRSVVAPSWRNASNAVRSGSRSPPRAVPRRTADDSSSSRTPSRSSRSSGPKRTVAMRPFARVSTRPSPCEQLERAAHGAAADLELGGQLRLDERRALGQLAVDDRLAQHAGDPAGVETARELDRVLADGGGHRIGFENC